MKTILLNVAWKALVAGVIGGFVGSYSDEHHWFALGLLLCAVVGVAIGLLPDIGVRR